MILPEPNGTLVYQHSLTRIFGSRDTDTGERSVTWYIKYFLPTSYKQGYFQNILRRSVSCSEAKLWFNVLKSIIFSK